MTVIGAMLLDAYRELNSRKLFWITLILSGTVVLGYGSMGFNEKGPSMFFGLWQIESEGLAEGSPWARALYMGIFSDFMVSIWLAWVATIIALISTTTIFPDFMASGAIDLVLSKPIGRVKIFFIKYLASLLFVVLQVGLFCAGIFLCVGGRMGEWNPKIFLAVPLVTVFYSYLYAFNVLLAVLTRSSLAALMLTLLFWVSLFSLQSTEAIVKSFQLNFIVQTERSDKDIEDLQARLDAIPEDQAEPRERIEVLIEEATEARDDLVKIETGLTRWHRRIRIIIAPLPKTALTIELLSRALKDPEGFSIVAMMRGDMSGGRGAGTGKIDAEVSRRQEAYYDAMPAWRIVGTSLGFEAVVLAIACFIFIRRDY